MKNKILVTLFIAFAFSSSAQVNSLLTNDTDSKRFFLFGSTAITSLDDLKNSLTASQKFSGMIVLKEKHVGTSKTDKSKCGIDAYFSINSLNIKPVAVNRDSLSIVSLMFPDAGNFGVFVSPKFHYCSKQGDKKTLTHTWSGEISGAFRQATIDNLPILNSNDSVIGTRSTSFSVLNWNFMPIKYSVHYEPDKEFFIDASLGIYYNLFNIPDEDAQNFNLLFPIAVFDSVNGSAYNSFGGKFTFRINALSFFFDLRKNLNNELDDSNPLKGTVFNFGFSTDIVIFSK